MPTTPRSPPRFVPTLTEVVPDIAPAVPPPAPEAAQSTMGLVSALAVAEHGVPAAPDAPNVGASPQLPVPPAPPLPDGFEELLVHRVMQRVDVGLDQRLRDAIATVVQEQTRSLLPRLREEIESVVRQVVYEAVAEELERRQEAPPDLHL